MGKATRKRYIDKTWRKRRHPYPSRISIMASSSSRPERVYHQDYIARIRYSNALPPPPGLPKLLEVPINGVSRYTSAAFGAKIAREQPLNIEVDAELGMPIDLVGLPGIFDGDESSIMAPPNPPPIDPRDKALLRPLSSLGKPTSVTSGVSFLRRTEYISSEQSRSRFESNTSRNLVKSSGNFRKKKQPDAARDDPVNIMRSVVKGFDIAYPEDAYKGPDSGSNIRGAAPTQAETAAWNKPKHPTNPNLTVVDSYPVVPDLGAFPDAGGYMVMKFSTNPSQVSKTYDPRLDVALLQPLPLRPEIEAEQEAKRQAHDADPAHNPAPGPPPYDYTYFLPTDGNAVPNIKRKFDPNDPGKDDEGLYTNKNKETQEGNFQYGRVRVYETATTTSSVDQKYSEVALALHHPKKDTDSGSQKAAHYYPILTKSQLRPRRAKNIAQLGMAGSNVKRDEYEEAKEQIDLLDVTVRDADEVEAEARAIHRAEVDSKTDRPDSDNTQQTQPTSQ